MVGRYLGRPVVSRAVVVATATAVGNRPSSRLVGRLLRGRLVRRAVVVSVSSRPGRAASPGLVGRLRQSSLLAAGRMVVAERSELGTRKSSRMVGRVRRQ